ncbi:MAG: helix-hairpin-helix domain-containing protein [Acidobacteriota bacterium]
MLTFNNRGYSLVGMSDSFTKPDNPAVARMLNDIAGILEFKDENAFKIRSYRMAAETIDTMQDQVAELAERGGSAELQKIQGIGKGISAQIVEIVETGKSSYFEELTRDLPATVLDLRRVSGIGLKTAQLLYRDLGIKSLPELKVFAEGGGLTSVPGLGEKSAARIKASLGRIEALTASEQ